MRPKRAALPIQRSLSEALIERTEPAVVVRPVDEPSLLTEARNAVHGYAPQPGDRVLVDADTRGRLYVTGVLASSVQARFEDGQLVVRSGETLVLRYDPHDRCVHVAASAGLRIEAPHQKLELRAKEVSIESETLRQTATHILTSADRWDLRVNRLRERAKHVFRDVEELLQTRAGSVRTIARDALSLFANRTTIRSKKDTAVDGERVLLG